MVLLLLIYGDSEGENLYFDVTNVEEICFDFHYANVLIDIMRMKLFPQTLKDRAKILFDTLRPRSICK